MLSLGSLIDTNEDTRFAIGVNMLSPRLNRLDIERQLSMADEGGMAAAQLENRSEVRTQSRWPIYGFIAAVTLCTGALGLIALKNYQKYSTQSF